MEEENNELTAVEEVLETDDKIIDEVSKQPKRAKNTKEKANSTPNRKTVTRNIETGKKIDIKPDDESNEIKVGSKVVCTGVMRSSSSGGYYLDGNKIHGTVLEIEENADFKYGVSLRGNEVNWWGNEESIEKTK